MLFFKKIKYLFKRVIMALGIKDIKSIIDDLNPSQKVLKWVVAILIVALIGTGYFSIKGLKKDESNYGDLLKKMEKHNINYILITKDMEDIKVEVDKQLKGQKNLFLKMIENNNEEISKKFKTLLKNVKLKNAQTEELLTEILAKKSEMVYLETEEEPLIKTTLNKILEEVEAYEEKMLTTEIAPIIPDTFYFENKIAIDENKTIVDTVEYRKILFFKFKKRNK